MMAIRRACLGVLLLLCAACAREEAPAAVAEDEPVAPPPAELTPTISIQRAALEELANSGVTGEVVANPTVDQIDVVLEVRGAPPQREIIARVERGPCTELGGEVAPLQRITVDEVGAGRSVTRVRTRPEALLDGQHVVAVYAAAANLDETEPLACGALPPA